MECTPTSAEPDWSSAQPLEEEKSLQEHPFTCSVSEITPTLLARMPYTWQPSSPVPQKDLRHLKITHYDFKGAVKLGEIVVHQAVVEDLQSIFAELFAIKFPIESMRFVDEFEGSDLQSMQANNSSAFYARKVAGTDRWSNHSFGCAIDINPRINPYSKGTFFTPPEGEKYLDRTKLVPGMITEETPIYQIFKTYGWEWGGECFYERDGVIDRHHFQKIVPGLNRSTN